MSKQPKRCPFCGCQLIYSETEVKALPGSPLIKCWVHPKVSCFCDGFEIMPDEVPAWNQRADLH